MSYDSSNKISNDRIRIALEDDGVSKIMYNDNIIKLAECMDERQVFGRKDVMLIFDCGITHASKVLNVMKN